MNAQNIPENERVHLSTGGSTGEPLAFYRTRHDQRDWGFAASERFINWTGYELGDKVASLAVKRPYKSSLDKLSQESKRFFQRSILYDVKAMSDSAMPHLAGELKRFNPTFLGGYPGAIELLACYIQREGGPLLKPKAILTGAEQLYDHQRDLFRLVFGCQSFSCYSSWEVHAIAGECERHSGFHIAAENVIVEILDERGNPLPAGREGRIVLTNLHNYAMPFIRYDIGDIGVASDAPCGCGRGLPMLSEIKGRVTDLIATTDGKTIPGAAMSHVIKDLSHVEQFQMVQERLDRITVRLVMGAECTAQYLDDVAKNIEGRYRQILGEDMGVSVQYVAEIPLTRDGKRRIVISNIVPDSQVDNKEA